MKRPPEIAPLLDALLKGEISESLQAKLQTDGIGFTEMFIYTYKMVMSTDELLHALSKQLLEKPDENNWKILRFLQEWVASDIHTDDLRHEETRQLFHAIIQCAEQQGEELKEEGKALEGLLKAAALSETPPFIEEPISLDDLTQTLFGLSVLKSRNPVNIQSINQDAIGLLSKKMGLLYGQSSVGDLIQMSKKGNEPAAKKIAHQEDSINIFFENFIKQAEQKGQMDKAVPFLFNLAEQALQEGMYFLMQSIMSNFDKKNPPSALPKYKPLTKKVLGLFSKREVISKVDPLVAVHKFLSAVDSYKGLIETVHQWAYAIAHTPADKQPGKIDSALEALNQLTLKVKEYQQNPAIDYHYTSEAIRNLQAHLAAFDRLMQARAILPSPSQKQAADTLHVQFKQLKGDEFIDFQKNNTNQVFKAAFEKTDLTKFPFPCFSPINNLMARSGEQCSLTNKNEEGEKTINLRALAGYAKYFQNFEAVIKYSRKNA